MLDRLIARQLRFPKGIAGHVIARLMNKHNAPMNRFVLNHLQVQPEHRVLDIGFGGGATLPVLAAAVNPGKVWGLEISDTMLNKARRRYRVLVRDGRLELTKGVVEEMPYPDERFDRVCTVNTLYFWIDPGAAITEIFRVTRVGGLIALGFRPKETREKMSFTRHGFTFYSREEVEALLKQGGFTGVSFDEDRDEYLGFICVIAERP